MQFLSYSVMALTAMAGSLAAPSVAPAVINPASVIPSIFQEAGLAAAATPLALTFNLNGANLDGLTQYMDTNGASLPDPLTPEQLAAYATPSAADLSTVESYLTSQGFKQSDFTYSAFKEQITVPATVGQAAKMFATTFNTYNVNGISVPRAKTYTIPSEIANVVTHVSPINSFVNLKTGPIKKNVSPAKRRDMWAREFNARATKPAACSTAKVTPDCLRQLYQTNTYTPKSVNSNVDVFIAGFISQSFSQTDETTFLQKYRADAASYKTPVINRAGAVNVPLMPGIEAMLDTETIASQIYPLKSTFYNYGNQLSQGDIFAAAFQDIINNYSKYGKPGVYSISYGADENSVTAAEAKTLCTAAQKLAALGTTIVLSSGDNGVGGSQGDTCPNFVPTYPSGCPYILSVGATQNFAPEVAVDPSLGGFYSGSGFSNLFSRPSYQNTAVSNYLTALGTTDKGYYNAAGRGYPDVSAQGSLYVITYLGMDTLVSGTSASAPTTASVIALLNNARQQKGKGNVGYLNPYVYANPSLFTDVTQGTSNGCGSTNYGFPCKAGWDPSTGVGTPLFTSLRTAMGV